MSDILRIKNKKVFILGIILLIIVLVIFIINKLNRNENLDLQDEILVRNTTEDSNTDNKEKNENTIIIHVAGEVRKPGIVKLKDGARIEDAIDTAGGLTENADISEINLAYVLEDGSKLNIPSKREEIEENNQKVNSTLSKESGNVLENDYSENKEDKEANKQNNKRINVNKATKEEFEELPGIGTSLAERIIEFRRINGSFKNIEDLKQVNGIGDSKFEKFKEYIYVK